MATKRQRKTNELSNRRNNLPICNICKKPISNPWDAYERFSYKTINGKIKTEWLCLGCQLDMS